MQAPLLLTGPVTRASTRAFVDEHISPYADAYDRAGAIPEELLERIGDAGLWAPFLPPAVGGAGLDLVTLGEVHEEVGRGCSSVRSLLTVHTMASWAVQRWGNAEQLARWGPELASGRTLGAFCLSEPGAGSDTSNLATTAVARGGDWLLNGVKTWTTGGQRADLFLVFARTASSIVALLVPRDTPGCRCGRSTTCSAPGRRCWPRSPSPTCYSAGKPSSARAPSPPGWCSPARWTSAGTASPPAASASSRPAWTPASATPPAAGSAARRCATCR